MATSATAAAAPSTRTSWARHAAAAAAQRPSCAPCASSSSASAARHRYFVGKDNIWFHTVWWPAILLGSGQGLHLPDEVVANHHLTLAGGKLSASRGHGPSIDDSIDRVGVDPLRHALCALGPETDDTELAWAKVEELNRRLAATEPWRLPDARAHQELTRLLPFLDALGVAAWPFVPDTAGRVRALFGRPPVPTRWAVEPRPPLVPVQPSPPLPRQRVGGTVA